MRDGNRLAYGGILGDSKAKLTESLIDTALGWLREESAQEADITRPESWPLVNYGAWPYHTFVSPERRAELVGVCHFVDVPPLRATADELARLRDVWKTDRQARRYTADALTRMREESTTKTDLRIVWGGKIRGATGWMAGIAEEVLFSLKLKKPTLILGGFGGCARVLADFIIDQNAAWPEALTLADACKNTHYNELIEDYARPRLAARYGELEQLLTQLRTTLHKGQDIFQIPAAIFHEALQTTSARRLMQLVEEAITRLDTGSPSQKELGS